MGLLDGKVAVITGAARGQGEAEARLFHAEGASLILTDVNPAGETLAKALGGNAIFQRLDVAVQADWHAVADLAKRLFGKVDVLVNNAGINGFEPIDAITPAEMQRYLDIHVFGPLFGIQAIIPLMPAGGSIVNIASGAALRGFKNFVGYGTSKWALRGLGHYAAHDLVDRGIRVNTVLPGSVDTPMLMQGGPAGAELIEAVRVTIPMKRLASAHELAQAVLFLASDQSSYMTGAELVVDGGLSA